MKIGIIGAKNIGGVLGGKWAASGHQIKFGMRNPDKPETKGMAAKLGGNASLGTIEECIDYGNIILLALPGKAVGETVQKYAGKFSGKAVIDATNNIGNPVLNGYGFFREHAKNADYYRAFNSLGWENFENPKFGSIVADLFYCGGKDGYQKDIEKLIGDAGLNPVYLGGLENINIVDSVLWLWFELSANQGYGRHMALKVIKD